MKDARPDYHATYAGFSLAALEKDLSGDLSKGINVCVEACDRHDGDAIALYWENERGGSGTVTFGKLRERAARFANVLTSLGVKPGDRVAGLLPRTPDLLTVVLGVLRAGAVYQPLFTAFGSKAIEHRIRSAGTKLVVTDAANRAKLDDVQDLPPVAILADAVPPGDIDLRRALDEASASFVPVMRTGDDAMFMMFTSVHAQPRSLGNGAFP